MNFFFLQFINVPRITQMKYASVKILEIRIEVSARKTCETNSSKNKGSKIKNSPIALRRSKVRLSSLRGVDVKGTYSRIQFINWSMF